MESDITGIGADLGYRPRARIRWTPPYQQRSSSPGQFTRIEQRLERRRVERRDAQLLGLLELAGTGRLTDHEGECLLRHAAGRLAAPRHDRLLGPLPRVVRDRAGHHHRLALERLRE